MITFFAQIPWQVWWFGSGALMAMGVGIVNYRNGQDLKLSDLLALAGLALIPPIFFVCILLAVFLILEDDGFFEKIMVKGRAPVETEWFVGYPSEDGVYEVLVPPFWSEPLYARWVATMGWSNATHDRGWLNHSPLPFDPEKQNLRWRYPKL